MNSSALSSSEGSPRSPLNSTHISRFASKYSDTNTALGQQMSAIFANLNSARDSRPTRVEECLSALMDTLFVHAEEIDGNEVLQGLLLHLVEQTFEKSIDKGCRSFQVVFDMKWKDQHDKRCRCLERLIGQALRCDGAESCGRISECIGEVLGENTLTTTDMLGHHMGSIADGLRNYSDAHRQAACAEILAKFVEVSASVIKRNPALLERLTSSLPPLTLLQMAVETEHQWNREAFINLLTNIIKNNCFDVTSQMASQIAEMVNGYIQSLTEERQLAGLLFIISSMAIAPKLAHASWNLPAICQFLVKRDWSGFAPETRALAACTTGKVCRVLFGNEEYYDDMCMRFIRFIHTGEEAVVVPALEVCNTFVESGRPLPRVGEYVEALRECIRRLPFIPSLFTVIETIRTRFGDAAVSPIHSMVDEYMQMDQDLVNFGKLNSLLHFMGKSAPLHRPDVLALRINIASSRPIPVILRSLPLLVTLDRTNQLDEAVELLFHVDVKVRHAAISSVVALCKVLIARTTEEMSGQNGAVAANQRLNSQVSRSVERLLDVAVADVVPEVRLNALRHFSEPFYSYLCLPDCLEALFMARNDSHRVVRDESLVLLCRLHPFHPAIVHPQLLRAQEYMLRDVDVQDSSISLATYRSDLLRMCADHGALLVPPKLIESVVLQRLSQQSFISKKFCMSVLGLIQSLLQHSGPEGHVDVDLFTEPLLSLINGNESSMLRAAALHALCAILTTFTPDISTSLEAYRCVARIIRCEAETEEVDSVTVAAMQVLSTLGAANPVKLRKVLRLLEQDAMEKEGESANTGSSQLKPKMRITPDVSERYPSVFVYYLLKALQHSVDSRQQVEVLMTVYTVVHDLPGNQRTVILSHLLPQLRALLEDSERVHLIEQVLRLLCELTSLLRLYKSLVPSTTGLEIMQSVQQFCTLPQASQMPFNANVVQMLDDLAKIIPAQEIQANRWAVEFIHQRLSQNKNDLDLVVRVVKSLESYLAVMHEKDLQLILPHVLQCMEPISDAVDESKMMEVNAACFEFLNLLFTKQPSLVRDCCAQIVHTIMWFVELSESKTDMEVGLNTLACLIEVVRGPGQRFVMLVERVATQKGYPAGYFESLVRSAATGLPASFPRHHMSALLPDQPLFVICQRAGLTLNDFDGEMRNTLRLRAEEYALLEVSHQGHQSVVTLRFTAGPSLKECFQLFLRKAMDPRSTFSRNVCVVNVEQAKEPRGTNYSHVFGILSKVPSAKSKKREQSWIAWLHTACVLLTRYSSRCYFESSARFVERNAEFSRDVFPFVAVSAISQMELADRQQLMDIFSRAVVMSPIDTKQVLFALAEFMEAERGEQKEKMVKRAQQTVFAVCRNSVEEKFGINYDLDPVNGVTVTKLAPNGLGAKAGVPLGGRLLAINGNPVHAVGDIRSLIDGLLRIELCILHVVEERQRQEPKYLMSIDALATVAFESQMHAKAIYFNEILFEQLCHSIGEKEVDRQDAVVRRILAVAERLIEFYRHLNFTMTASGFVKHLTRKFSENVIAPEQLGFDAIGTLEQLHWWSEALRRYESRMTNAEDGSLSIKSFVGALRCEEALGHISVTNELIQQHWANLSEQERIEVAPYRAKAAFSLGLWSIFDDLATDSRLVARFGMVEHCAALFRAGQFDQLLSYTESSREAMLESFSESFSESYSRSYDQLVELQHLTHFEELVSYRRSSPDRQEMLRQLWYRRMSHMSLKPNNLNTLLSINSLVLNPDEDLAAQVLAIRSLTKSQWYGMAQHLLKKLGLDAPTKTELLNRQPELIHAYTKFLYTTGKRIDAYHLLHEVLDDLDLGNRGADNGEQWGWCWLLLGEWTMCLFPDRGEEAIMELIRATELCPDNYAPFHSLGILHYDLSRDPNTPQEVQVEHHIQAVIALFRSVQLCTEHSNMQDILRILSIWFSHSTVPRLNEMMHVGMSNLPDHVWVDVIPQLIARIGITARSARAILADLLVRVGRRYPQALIYPLTVAEKSPDAVRRLMAERVLSSIRSINNQMVKEASLISNEMVRIAILWTETWHAAIQQAATQPESPQYILRVLSPLFVDLEQPITPNERTFEKTFGPTLKRAKLALQEKRADKAWVFLKQVYAQLGKMLGERRLSMNDVSPTLDSIRHSIVAVPGTFEHGKPLVTIEEFHSKVYVMSSKQKPRRLGLDASNGQAYRFLLKGHEDMRQDERVMQFMGLINTIFETDNASLAIGLAIPRYAVIPLTDNVGIIGWVENTETIYKMLEVYRQKSGVSIYEEVNLIMKRGGLRNIEEFQKLPKPHRRSLLSDTMDATPEDELRRIMWERNDTCEQWLGYRDAYGHSLATMSMVGYVLGLGDRHLNNLMLQDNGTVVHIDFGDCFEVAMHRSLYAEAVPFRLTRLLIAALGITQVDGVYRLTCELVMKNLRRHSENLLSILEAFIYDPLINWRLNVNDNDPTNTEATKSQSKGEHGGRASTSSKASFSHVLDDVQEPEEPAHMQLSKSFAKQHVHHLPHDPDEGNVGVMECTEEETKNQQGHVALARVHAKLTGQDFAITNTSFSFLHSSRRMEESHRGSSWGSGSSMFGGSPKDSGVPLLPTYLSLRALNGGVDCLDVPHQVNRLIQEATSLDNLAEAYLTGWAPFW